jgi:hypothetical protein
MRAVLTCGGREEVEVPAGRFATVRVDWEFTFVGDKPRWATYWFAAGVGPVKMVNEYEEWVLKSFTLPKD